ncbi:MAG: WD40 repeat domain-containing protein [Planctomycetes bacterium]|nr:WD40 repeat domain-containing protein [Planctomycetota bacterium]
MLTVVRAMVLFALVAGVVVPLAQAQSDAPDPKELQKKFLAEREQAVKAKFPTDTLTRADELAKRAEAALKSDSPKAAAKYFRDARWQLPYLPVGLPDHVSRVLGESRMRHADRVNAVTYSTDGTRLASCSKDGTVKVWDLGNGREITTYRAHIDQPDDPTKGGTAGGTNVLGVTDVAFHPKDAKVIASACGNQVHLWNPANGKPIKTLVNLGKTDKPVKSIAYSPDGKQLAVGSDDGILRVYESDTGKATYTSPTRNARIERVAFSPNGLMVAVGDSNTFAAVYAPTTPNPLAMTAQAVNTGEVMGVAFTPDNANVLTCGRDGIVRLTAGPKPDGSTAGNTSTRLREYSGHSGAVTCLAVIPDGSLMVTGGEDKTVRVWEIGSGKQVRSLQGHLGRVTAVATRGDGKQIASASEDGAIRMWDLSTDDEHRALSEASDSLWAVAFSPDGKHVAAAGADKNIRVYNPETGKLEATLSGAKSAITSLAFLPDSNKLVAAGGDQVVVIWDVQKQKVIEELTGHESAVLSVATSEDGKLIVSGSADKTARGYDGETNKPVWAWNGRSAVCAVAIRKGNKTVAIGLADGSLVVLDVTVKTPKELFLQSAHVAGVACIAYSPDGNRVATVGGDGALRVWTVADNGTLTQLVKFDGQSKPGGNFSPLTGVAFAPDGRYVAGVGADSVVRVWDIQTKSEVRGLRGHTDWVTSVAFSPDGRFLASVGVEKDKVLRIFELPPLETSSGGGHVQGVNAVAVSPNGKFAATAGTDQTIKIWDLGTGKEVGTLIGNADIPFSLTYLTNDSLVMGVGLQTRDTGRLHYWSTNPGRLTKSVPTGEVYSLVANKDGSKIAAWASRPAVGDTVKNNTYELYDVKDNGTPKTTISDKGRKVLAATFSADLDWAISGDESGGVRIWDMTKKEPVGANWPLFANAVQDLGITADKKLLVAVDSKGDVKIAGIEKREVLGTVAAHKSGVRTLLVSPTGTTFMTVSNDREVKAWSLAAGDLKEPKAIRTWNFPVGVNALAYTPDGKQVVTANADGTAYVLELP